jgi:hypothetical protein
LKFANEPYEIIVMEDLKAMGYESVDRKAGASIEQTKSFLSKLAKFHATSAIRYQKVFFLYLIYSTTFNPFKVMSIIGRCYQSNLSRS